jgi:hypothetical protein
MLRILKSFLVLTGLCSSALGGPCGAAELKIISQVRIPGAALNSFDSSYVDQKTNQYFLADQNNKAIDMFDVTNGTLIAQVSSFVMKPAPAFLTFVSPLDDDKLRFRRTLKFFTN